ncbi:nucleoside triphosphate pyrophosphohydrolase [Fictibacillus fluitans]|uniref:Nucleoside triphosphate pyrophosphohydrolase n=1 Tax=Fictibacillus fluitans TaxID=3058422 RepID=A0ABT8HYY2_9BACL|nr:nucleoside triphosphate pyrophosphohydrolase [Fictibacillus sp. NE201]MDN4525951.1 nucleoside triphosphate pyrophosphohydrolase [Fictibacillus sp. NE201]
MPFYNKLVRDKIPEVIAKTGKSFNTTLLEKDAYIKELKKKCYEELDEYASAESDVHAIEELADLLELMHALSKVHGADISEVDRVRQEKAEKRGGFEKRIFLVNVEDE